MTEEVQSQEPEQIEVAYEYFRTRLVIAGFDDLQDDAARWRHLTDDAVGMQTFLLRDAIDCTGRLISQSAEGNAKFNNFGFRADMCARLLENCKKLKFHSTTAFITEIYVRDVDGKLEITYFISMLVMQDEMPTPVVLYSGTIQGLDLLAVEDAYTPQRQVEPTPSIDGVSDAHILSETNFQTMPEMENNATLIMDGKDMSDQL